MTSPIAILETAMNLIRDRGLHYDNEKSGVEENFTRAASIASLWLDRPVTARDVVLIMASVKMSRIAVRPDHADSFVDLCNYVAFGAVLSDPGAVDNTLGSAELTRPKVNGIGA